MSRVELAIEAPVDAIVRDSGDPPIYRWRALNEAGMPVYVGTVQSYDAAEVERELERLLTFYGDGHPNVWRLEVDAFVYAFTRDVEVDRSQEKIDEWYTKHGGPEEAARA